MILKLDPRYPVVWRSPSSIQVGIDPPLVVLNNVTASQERLLAALEVGVSETGVAVVAKGSGELSRELLEAMRPAMLDAESADQGEQAHDDQLLPSVALSGTGPLVDELARVLGGTGVQVLTADDPASLANAQVDFAVATAHFVLPPVLHALWLRRDITHLPVVFSESGVVVGPIVEPGVGPCLRCLELHRRDLDPAWPAVATQLLGRRSGAESPLLASEGAAAAARLVLERLAGRPAGASVSLRIDGATGERTTQGWHEHPGCGCRGIEHLSSTPGAATPARSGTDWAAALRSSRAADLLTS
jgi:bacteriocin biosynthesis cyclodehydratase domain-containing protein